MFPCIGHKKEIMGDSVGKNNISPPNSLPFCNSSETIQFLAFRRCCVCYLCCVDEGCTRPNNNKNGNKANSSSINPAPSTFKSDVWVILLFKNVRRHTTYVHKGHENKYLKIVNRVFLLFTKSTVKHFKQILKGITT